MAKENERISLKVKKNIKERKKANANHSKSFPKLYMK